MIQIYMGAKTLIYYLHQDIFATNSLPDRMYIFQPCALLKTTTCLARRVYYLSFIRLIAERYCSRGILTYHVGLVVFLWYHRAKVSVVIKKKKNQNNTSVKCVTLTTCCHSMSDLVKTRCEVLFLSVWASVCPMSHVIAPWLYGYDCQRPERNPLPPNSQRESLAAGFMSV